MTLFNSIRSFFSDSTVVNTPVVDVTHTEGMTDEFYAKMTMERLLDDTAQPFSWAAKRKAYLEVLRTGNYVEFLAKYHDLASVRAIYRKKLLAR